MIRLIYLVLSITFAKGNAGREYDEYFSEKMQEYSDGALDVKWSEKEGYSIVVQRKIKTGEVPLKVPCKYSVSAFDQFVYKDELLAILKNVPEVQ